MNWKLKFTQFGTFVEILDKDKHTIMRRKFAGWQKRSLESNDPLIPNVELQKGEKLIAKQDNIYIV